MTLWKESGGDLSSRLDEVERIVAKLESELGMMTEKERYFVISMGEATACSPKQLFWLRDLCEKYL